MVKAKAKTLDFHAVFKGTRPTPTSLLISMYDRTFVAFAICRRPSICPSVCRLSSVCLSVTFVRPTQAIGIFGNYSTPWVPWPSINIQVKFYGDRPRGTPPSGELNTRGVTEFSDFGPIEHHISETVQDRR